MKKSKTLYLVALVLLMGIALADHLLIDNEPQQIAVGSPDEESQKYQFAIFTD
ncbi:MAG: hypothetical protein HRT61_09300 [Ekhidna sp.]|nr:hypothetical protein [Ekhidna sp.]